MSKRKNDEENLELDDSEKKKVKLNDVESLEEGATENDIKKAKKEENMEKDIKIVEKEEKEKELIERNKWVNKWKNRWKKAKRYQIKGDRFYEQENFGVARSCYLKALKFDSLNVVHYDNLALTLTALNKYKNAINYFKLGLKYSPVDFNINYNCGRTFNMMKKYKEAICYLQSAIKIDPSYEYSYFALGNSYLGLCQFENAIEKYKKSIELNPDISDAYFQIGNCYLKIGKVGEAIGYFKREIEIVPENAPAYNNLGVILESYEKRYDESICYLKKAIEIDPNYVNSYYNLGITYRNIRDYDNAIEQFKEVIKRESESLDGDLILGETLYQVGRYKEALEHQGKVRGIGENKKFELISPQTKIMFHSCAVFPLIKLKEFEKAKIEIQSCFSQPEDSFDLFCYGIILYKLKEYQSAYLSLLNSILIGGVKYNDLISKTKYYLAMTLIKVNENNNYNKNNNNNNNNNNNGNNNDKITIDKITEDKIMQNFNDCIAAEPNWSKVYYRIAQFLNMKFPIEKKEEIKSNYFIAIEKNNLMHPCDRLSDLKITKILETISLL